MNAPSAKQPLRGTFRDNRSRPRAAPARRAIHRERFNRHRGRGPTRLAHLQGTGSDADATSVTRLESAGGILLAKTNLPEISYRIESDNLLTGPSTNPWDVERTPGGSSGGESAAVAAGMSPLASAPIWRSVCADPLAKQASSREGYSRTHAHDRIWPRAPRGFWHVGPMAREQRHFEPGHECRRRLAEAASGVTDMDSGTRDALALSSRRYTST
ncbi:amidase family protein [Caballeronia sp. RCC_10]|uniref:amidase family protein n=1 Tax=Caballeronia sp. RCC_10 TaxID=3239227 RepID=UPI003523ED23